MYKNIDDSLSKIKIQFDSMNEELLHSKKLNDRVLNYIKDFKNNNELPILNSIEGDYVSIKKSELMDIFRLLVFIEEVLDGNGTIPF